MPPLEQSNIIISEQTKESISCISDKLDEWVPEDMTVLILSPEDLVNFEQFYASLPEAFKQNFEKEQFEQLKSKGPCCSTIDIDGDGLNDIGYILTPSISATKEEIATGYTNITPENLTLPGTSEEWRAAVVTHEIGHLDQKKGMIEGRLAILGKEMEADQNSIDLFSQINPEVAQARIECRILGAFTGGTAFQNSHITSAGVRITSNDYIPDLDELTQAQYEEIYQEILELSKNVDVLNEGDKQEFENALNEGRRASLALLSSDAVRYLEEKCRYAYATQYADGLKDARYTTYFEIGVENFQFFDANGNHATPPSFKKEILSSTRPGNIKIQEGEVSPEDQRIIDQILEDQIPFEEGLSFITPELVRNYEHSLESMISSIGKSIADQSPQRLYETASELYSSDAFSQTSIAEQYIWEFLEAGRKLAPLYFNLPADMPPFDPPFHESKTKQTNTFQPFERITHTQILPSSTH